MQKSGAAFVVFALCLGGCGARTGNDSAGGGNNAMAANAVAPAVNGLAAGNEAAPAGPCPFPNRNWRAAVALDGTPPTLRIALTGEIRHDSSDRSPMLSSADTPPPTVFLDISSEGSLPPPPAGNSADGMQAAPAGGWDEATTYYDYHPGHTTAVIRCNGREVTRVAIPAPH
jgi:hypothetical protein